MWFIQINACWCCSEKSWAACLWFDASRTKYPDPSVLHHKWITFFNMICSTFYCLAVQNDNINFCRAKSIIKNRFRKCNLKLFTFLKPDIISRKFNTACYNHFLQISVGKSKAWSFTWVVTDSSSTKSGYSEPFHG